MHESTPVEIDLIRSMPKNTADEGDGYEKVLVETDDDFPPLEDVNDLFTVNGDESCAEDESCEEESESECEWSGSEFEDLPGARLRRDLKRERSLFGSSIAPIASTELDESGISEGENPSGGTRLAAQRYKEPKRKKSQKHGNH